MEIERTAKINAIGHGLKEAKVTVNQDIKYSVADVQIDGKQGEVLNLPRWIGNILAKEGLAELDKPDMITELKQALSKEKMVGEFQLSTLDPHFYIKLKETMSDLNKHDYDYVESIFRELFRMRRGKIIKLADSTKLSAELNNKLTVEERIFFKTLNESSTDFEKQVLGVKHE